MFVIVTLPSAFPLSWFITGVFNTYNAMSVGSCAGTSCPLGALS